MTETAYSEISLEELDSRLRKQLESAEQNISRNPAYAIEICQNILRTWPGALDVRKVLRKAQKRAKTGKSGGLGGRITGTLAPFKAKLGKKDPALVMDEAETMITKDPGNKAAYRILGQAAEALGLWETAVFAYQGYRELDKANGEVNAALAHALIEADHPKEAIKLCSQVLTDHPSDERMQQLLKDASVRESMVRSKVDQEDAALHERLANKEEAIELEQRARVVNDEDTVEQLVASNLKQLEKEPENLNLYREIINSYRRIGKYEKALEYVDKARATSAGKSDPTLERLGSDLKAARMRAEIKELETQLENDPENAELKEKLENLGNEEREFRRANAERTVEKYPNDYGARFELGRLYFEEGRFDDAIGELQKARQNPNVRVKAMLLLGKAFRQKGIHDMAVEQLQEAKKEIPGMDDLKKEIVYELATAHELGGDDEAAIKEYKLIYSNDISYKDVSAKIDQFYSKG